MNAHYIEGLKIELVLAEQPDPVSYVISTEIGSLWLHMALRDTKESHD